MLCTSLQTWASVECRDLQAVQNNRQALSLMTNSSEVQSSSLYKDTQSAYQKIYRELLSVRGLDQLNEFKSELKECEQERLVIETLDMNQVNQQLGKANAEKLRQAIATYNDGRDPVQVIFVLGVAYVIVGTGVTVATGGFATPILLIAGLLAVGTYGAIKVISYGMTIFKGNKERRLNPIADAETIEKLAQEMTNAQMNKVVGSALQPAAQTLP